VKKIKVEKIVFKEGTKEVTISDAVLIGKYVDVVIDEGSYVTLEVPIHYSMLQTEAGE
jgi:hypothetical protein